MKAGTFTKFWAVLMTLVVIAVAILAGVWFSNGTLTYNGGGEDEEETVAVAEDGSELASGGTVPMQNMTFKSAKTLATGADAQNEEYASVTLTATVTPSWATQDLSWSVAFSNPASEWATGKTVTDYVTVTPGETTLTATVQCLQPFGEQIVVTVSADEFDDVSATCTVDFGARIKTLLYKDSQNMGSDGNGIDLSTAEYIVWNHGFEEKNTFTVTTVYYDHTVSDAAAPYAGSAGYLFRSYSKATRTPYEDGVEVSLYKAGCSLSGYAGEETTLSLKDMTAGSNNYSAITEEASEELCTWLNMYAGTTDWYAMCPSIQNDYSEFTCEVPLRLTASNFPRTVSLSLDETAVTA